METLRRLLYSEFDYGSETGDPRNSNWVRLLISFALGVILFSLLYSLFHTHPALAAGTQLPGDDASDKLEAAGTLLKLLDTGIFKWGGRLFAGLCVMSSAWALKEQRFGMAVICVVGAILFGTATKWVRNIFEIGDSQGLFSQVHLVRPMPKLASIDRQSGAEVARG